MSGWCCFLFHCIYTYLLSISFPSLSLFIFLCLWYNTSVYWQKLPFFFFSLKEELRAGVVAGFFVLWFTDLWSVVSLLLLGCLLSFSSVYLSDTVGGVVGVGIHFRAFFPLLGSLLLHLLLLRTKLISCEIFACFRFVW